MILLKWKNHRFSFFCLSLILLLASNCSKSEETQPCDSASTILSDDGVCLKMEHTGLLKEHQDQIEAIIAAGVAAIDELMPIDQLQIRVVENTNLVIPEIGMGGYNPLTEEVIIANDASYPDLEKALDENLLAILAHEVHHAKRRRSVGYGNTLFQAAVSEGLADHFSMEVAGVAAPLWAVALTGVELQQWTEKASQSWNQPTYDHFAWFVGADPNIPRWAGYSIGFDLVKSYLSENPHKLPSRLHDEPASSFSPL